MVNKVGSHEECTGSYSSYDSYTDNSGKEYVVYNESQILPVYILYFDTNPQRGTIYNIASSGGTLVKIPGYKIVLVKNQEREHAKMKEERLNCSKEARLNNAEFFLGKRFMNRHITVNDHEDDDDDDSSWYCRTNGDDKYDYFQITDNYTESRTRNKHD